MKVAGLLTTALLTAALTGGVAVSTALAGTGYDLNVLLHRPMGAPAPSADTPLPRPAASTTIAQRRPPVMSKPTGEVAERREPRGGGGVLSEIRAGFLFHDQGPFSSSEEDGYDANLELLFTSPRFLDVIWSPRPHLGVSVNTEGDTSQVYFGLSWEWSFWGNWFAGFSLGGSVHDGELTTNLEDRKELGCRLLFRESVEAGYRFGGRHSVSLFLDHISNARLCDANEGLENWGIRYGYSF